MVFDKSKVDSFISLYEPLNYSNIIIKKDILLLTKTNFDNSISNNYSPFGINSELLDSSDFNLAMNTIKATYDKNGEKYFLGSLHYLFFYKCLPEGFQNKWIQTFLGDFRFNTTFFAMLRNKSKIIDKMMYGEIGNWDNKLKAIFGEYCTFNEITSEEAKKIKELIEKDQIFRDIRFRADRDKFIYFLDKTISNEWRLILRDWN